MYVFDPQAHQSTISARHHSIDVLLFAPDLNSVCKNMIREQNSKHGARIHVPANIRKRPRADWTKHYSQHTIFKAAEILRPSRAIFCWLAHSRAPWRGPRRTGRPPERNIVLNPILVVCRVSLAAVSFSKIIRVWKTDSHWSVLFYPCSCVVSVTCRVGVIPSRWTAISSGTK